MSRLTIQEAIEQIEDLEGFVLSETGSLPNDNDMEALEILKEAAIELQHYKELEEQGLLLKLPCKVGDTIWAIFPTWTPMECEVVAIEILSSTVNIETKVVDSDADRIFWTADFGKTVFLTKEEAEAKLKELKKGGTNET